MLMLLCRQLLQLLQASQAVDQLLISCNTPSTELIMSRVQAASLPVVINRSRAVLQMVPVHN
jgi:hypothetical protein